MGNTFNSIDALNRLKPAVEDNTSIMGMLEDLTGKDFTVIIDDVPFQDRGYLQAKIHRVKRQTGATIIAGAGAAGVIIFALTDEEEED